MDLKKLKDELKFEQDLTDENAADMICSLVDGLRKEVAELKAKAEGKPAATPPDPTKPQPPQASAMVMSALTENRKLRLEKLVMSGKISPAMRDEIDKQFITEEAMAMAFSADGKDGFDPMLALLDKLPPMVFGESTGPQVLELADKMKGKSAEKDVAASWDKAFKSASGQAA